MKKCVCAVCKNQDYINDTFWVEDQHSQPKPMTEKKEVSKVPLEKKKFIRFEHQIPEKPLDMEEEYFKSIFNLSSKFDLIKKEYSWEDLTEEEKEEARKKQKEIDLI